MSLNFITSFQQEIYKVINDSAEIKASISTIKLGPAFEAQPPAIVIGLRNISNLSTPLKKLYEVDFHIEIYMKNKNYTMLSNMANIVVNHIEKMKKSASTYTIISTRSQKIDFTTAKDLVIHKGTIIFKSSIMPKI